MEQRICTHCGQTYDLIEANFRLGKDGKWTPACRKCLREQHRKQREKEKERRKRSLEKVEEAGLDIYARLAAAGGSNIPHSAEVVEKVFEYFGGTGGFAAMLVKQYYDSPAGGSARNKLIETVCRLVQNNVDSGGAKKPLTLWTEDELEQELEKRFQQAVQSHRRGLTINAKALPAPEVKPAEAALAALVDAASAEGTPRATKRAKRAKARGAEVVPADPPPAEDSRMPSE